LAEYEDGPYAGFGEEVQKALAAIVPPDADASTVADAIIEVVNAPFGKLPFRVHVNVGFAVLDRLRTEMLRRVGLTVVLAPRAIV